MGQLYSTPVKKVTPVKKGGAKTEDKPTYKKIYAKAQDLTDTEFIQWMTEHKVIVLQKKKKAFEHIYEQGQDLTQKEFVKFIKKDPLFESEYTDVLEQIYDMAQDLTQQKFVMWLKGTLLYSKANDMTQTTFKQWLNKTEKN